MSVVITACIIKTLFRPDTAHPWQNTLANGIHSGYSSTIVYLTPDRGTASHMKPQIYRNGIRTGKEV
ncbi:MAG: hypothetical protein EA364_14840 [Balneolaceae bacterium]|nr:MAG: hypothetical protein EA364_14840 [Balneolaceae bacterium]